MTIKKIIKLIERYDVESPYTDDADRNRLHVAKQIEALFNTKLQSLQERIEGLKITPNTIWAYTDEDKIHQANYNRAMEDVLKLVAELKKEEGL